MRLSEFVVHAFRLLFAAARLAERILLLSVQAFKLEVKAAIFASKAEVSVVQTLGGVGGVMLGNGDPPVSNSAMPLLPATDTSNLPS